MECILQNEKGAYYIDGEECTGCLQCVDVCPEEVLFTHPEHEVPFKCTLSKECVYFCPYGALYVE